MASEEEVFTSKTDPEWYNRNRVLVVSSRGLTASQRQLMLSVFALLPHGKKDFKLEKQNVHEQISQLCTMHKCRYFLYFESKKKIRFSLWIGRFPEGPSIKFDIDGIVHVRDIKFQGNCVKGGRHILSFDEGFDCVPQMKIAKELMIGALNVPAFHPKSTAVFDHSLSFISDGNQILFKNYQIFREPVSKDKDKIDLYEIGPRFVLSFQCILGGVMCGEVLYRSSVHKKYYKKSKKDPRKNHQENVQYDLNLFGEEN